MPLTSIVFGILLILIGVAGYIYGVVTGTASFTALIPAAFGLVMAVLGAVANSSEGLRKHLMHASVIVGLLGFIVPLGRLLSKFSSFSWSPANISILATSAVCLVFVVIAVRSFIAARQNMT